MKKILLLALTACMGLGAWATVGDDVYGYASSGVYCHANITDDDNHYVTLYQIECFTQDATALEVPSTFTMDQTTYTITQVGSGSPLDVYVGWKATEGNYSVNWKITSVSFPESVAALGNYVFAGYSALNTITVNNSNATCSDNTFYFYKDETDYSPTYFCTNARLNIPYDSYYKNYNSKDIWKTFTDVHESTTVTIGSTGYATYYNAYPYILPEGIEGYSMTNSNKLDLIYTGSSTTTVHGGFGMLLKGNAGDYTFDIQPKATDPGWPEGKENRLGGSQEEATTTGWDGTECVFYKLANGENGLGWYYGDATTQNGSAFTNGAHKAYLVTPKVSGARSFIGFEFEGETTGIEGVNANVNVNANAYNIAGQRVNANAKGLVIINGKKVIK